MIVVAGGDGTVRAVAEAVHENDVSLALLPSGTGNLLARNLKLTLDDLEHSIHSAFTGEDRQIDLGMIDIRRADSKVDTHAYVVMAGLGPRREDAREHGRGAQGEDRLARLREGHRARAARQEPAAAQVQARLRARAGTSARTR